MRYLCIGLLVVAFVLSGILVAPQIYAKDQSSSDILKQGLLGAGAGAVGASVGKGKGGAWKGALAGAGVNVVGGALLDSMSGEHVSTTQEVQSMPSNQDAYGTGYKEGYNNGYKAGYQEGYKEGVAEAMERMRK